LARARAVRLKERHKVEISWLPYELHPEISDGGTANSRKFSALTPIAEGLEIVMRPPERFRPTRKAHQAALVVEHASPDEVDTYHQRLYEAVWVEERDIEDPLVLCDLAADLAVPHELIERVVTEDELLPAVRSSMERAHAWGATGTPSWVIDNKLMVPGLQDDEFFDRVIQRLESIRNAEGDAD
jgi:predicted DsbA family dithiol-disulfide isomerase